MTKINKEETLMQVNIPLCSSRTKYKTFKKDERKEIITEDDEKFL